MQSFASSLALTAVTLFSAFLAVLFGAQDAKPPSATSRPGDSKPRIARRR